MEKWRGEMTLFFSLYVAAVVLLAEGCCTVAAAPPATIHDLLRDHGLPPGLLPKMVRSFSLDQRTGLLIAKLDEPCYASWHDNPVFFDRTVAANMSYGQLNGVVGLSQEELFLWLPVKGVLVSDPSSGLLLLDIGVARKQLSLSLFDDPPDCRPVADSISVTSGIRKGRGRKEGKGREEQR